jgi:hypothetical protein
MQPEACHPESPLRFSKFLFLLLQLILHLASRHGRNVPVLSNTDYVIVYRRLFVLDSIPHAQTC